MLVKDKDILVQDETQTEENGKKTRKVVHRIAKENMSSAWGDAFDAYLRGITQYYLLFRGRSTRLEFWGYMVAAAIVWLCVYALGVYVEMPMLAYYYALATFIPTLAIAVRRLHDINKNAALYLGILPIIAICGLFIGWYVLIPLLAYLVILMRFWFMETDVQEGFFGPAKENDETYGEDNSYIMKKFLRLAIVLMLICSSITYVGFDDWSKQAEQKEIRNLIDDEIIKLTVEKQLTPEQIEFTKNIMKKTLSDLQGKSVSEEDLIKKVQSTVNSLQKDKK